MRNSITKTVVAAVAALGMATAVATISTPAEAQWHGGAAFMAAASTAAVLAAAFTAAVGAAAGWGWRRRPAGAGGWGAPAGAAGWGPGWGGGWGGGCWNCGGWGGGWGWGYDPGWAIAAATVPLGVAIAAIAAGLWRRSGLLGQAAGLDSGRPLSWPAAREHLQLSLDGRWIRRQIKKN